MESQTFFQKNKTLLVIGAVVVIVVLWAVGSYNSFVSGNQAVSSSWAQIDTQLQRRFDLVPNLVETVKGVAKQEQEVFGKIAEARANYAGAKTQDEKVAAANQYESALGRLLVITENYPQLKSSDAYIGLMTQLEGTENRIAVARKDYNDAVAPWNARVARFPGVIVAKIFGFDAKEYFKVADGAEQNPQVKF
ncbi:MAG TPA: LemA family protein [Candidatus Paceibacterota bacterium]|nr:LemA family protein [Candidatus Paceibacterota bacterium]